MAGREIKPGKILYNPPERMRVGETERIEADELARPVGVRKPHRVALGRDAAFIGNPPTDIKATFIYQGQTFKDLDPFERDVRVSVNPVYSTGRWLGGNWDKVLGTLGITVAGVFAYLYEWLRRRLNEQ